MKTSRMFYLVPPSMIQRAMLNEKNSTDSEPADVKLKRMVQQVGEAKIEEKNARDESWKNLGEKMKGIFGPPVTPAASASAAETSPDPAAQLPPDAEEDQIIKELEKKVDRRFRGKAVKFFMVLKDVPNVLVRPNEMTVNGKKLPGRPVAIIDNLMKNVKDMKYDVSPLLNKLVTDKLGATLLPLIGNKEAKMYLQQLTEPEPPMESTVGWSPENNAAFSTPRMKADKSGYVTADEYSFHSPKLGFGKNWLSLFSRNGKSRGAGSKCRGSKTATAKRGNGRARIAGKGKKGKR